MSSAGGGGGGVGKRKSKRAYFKRAAASKNSGQAAFDPVHSNCQFLVITADQGKERQCGHEMAAWCSEILQEKFPHIQTAQPTGPLPSESSAHALSSSTSSASSNTGSVSASTAVSVSVSDELQQELRELQDSDVDHRNKRRRLHGDAEDDDSGMVVAVESKNNGDAKSDDDDDNVLDEESGAAGEKQNKVDTKKKAATSSTPKEIIFPVSTTTVRVRGVVVLALNHALLSANELFEQLFSDVLDRGRICSRLAIRAFPVLAACFARMDELEKLCQNLLPTAFQSFPSSGTFSIVLNRRGNNAQMTRDAVIKMIADIVPKTYTVNLSSPDVIIIVELVERMAAIGCIKNNAKIPNFNLRKAHEIYIQTSMENSQNGLKDQAQHTTKLSNKRNADAANTNSEQQHKDKKEDDTEEKDNDNADARKEIAESEDSDNATVIEMNQAKKARTDP